MGTIRERIIEGNKKAYQVQVRRKGYTNQSATFDSKREAVTWMNEIEARMTASVFVETEADGMTVGQALDNWLAASKSSDTNKQRVANTVKQLRIFRITVERGLESKLEDTLISDLSPARVESLIKVMRSSKLKPLHGQERLGYSSNSIRLFLAPLQSAWKRATRRPIAESPVALAHERPGKLSERDRRLNAATTEEDRLLAACSEDLAYVVRLAIDTAMRQGEIWGLDWAFINFSAETITLPSSITKTDKPRIIPLIPSAKAALLELRNNLPALPLSGMVFKFTSSGAISKQFGSACKSAGIKDLHFHDLRHEATSRFVGWYGLSDTETMKITGHKTMQMLARYANLRANTEIAAKLRRNQEIANQAKAMGV